MANREGKAQSDPSVNGSDLDIPRGRKKARVRVMSRRERRTAFRGRLPSGSMKKPWVYCWAAHDSKAEHAVNR
ncbi:hypothetical protein ASZ90_000389 [hydrocarbon metagenome]|uniref:Uncharacterized protein n=1 Tax=hydrocarbon metagenome TaxID=938273 RepID=A0A0W8G9B3_9ZZZZ